MNIVAHLSMMNKIDFNWNISEKNCIHTAELNSTFCTVSFLGLLGRFFRGLGAITLISSPNACNLSANNNLILIIDK